MQKSFLQHALLPFAFLLLLTSAFTQTLSPQKIEQELLEIGLKIKSFSPRGQFSTDSLEHYNLLFSKKIFFGMNKVPETLSYPFEALIKSRSCSIATSADGLFRIYSWDKMGWTLPQNKFTNLYQFRVGSSVNCEVIIPGEDSLSFCFTDIFTLHANQDTFYLAVGRGEYSTNDPFVSIKNFTLQKHLLIDTMRIFKTPAGLSDSMHISYAITSDDITSVLDNSELPAKLITYDADKQLIYLPVLDEKNRVTAKVAVYQFNGQYFEQTGTQKRK